MILTPTMLTAMLKRDDADLSYIQQALATVCAQRGAEADTFLERILTSVPKRRAAVVRTLAAQVRAERSRATSGTLSRRGDSKGRPTLPPT
jgi:RNase P/RNase MRP subunit p30